MNRIILERVRCMRLGVGLPKSFWGEAISATIYGINRCLSSTINIKAPTKLWSLMAIMNRHDMELEHVKTAFLHGDLEETIYRHQ